MDWKLVTYTAYVLLSIALTVFVARSLFRHGDVFLVKVLHGDAEVARSINRLLVIGFYLVNFGFVMLALQTDALVGSATESMEVLSRKLGLVLLVVGAMHLLNLVVLNSARKRRAAPVYPGDPAYYPQAQATADAAGPNQQAAPAIHPPR